MTWWYSSGGRREWRYLRSATEQLHQVKLGDFDGDGRGDVFAVQNGTWVISSGGTSPFAPLPAAPAGIPFSELAVGDFNGDKRTDIFRRAPSGEWSAISPGVYPWTVLGSSVFELSSLRFGDFDGLYVGADAPTRHGGKAQWGVEAQPWCGPLKATPEGVSKALGARSDWDAGIRARLNEILGELTQLRRDAQTSASGAERFWETPRGKFTHGVPQGEVYSAAASPAEPPMWTPRSAPPPEAAQPPAPTPEPLMWIPPSAPPREAAQPPAPRREPSMWIPRSKS